MSRSAIADIPASNQVGKGVPASRVSKKVSASVLEMAWRGLDYRIPVLDSRLVREGLVIPAAYYVDQPYVAKTHDGAWLCVLTTGTGHEGSRGQHVVSLRSEDCGKTWSEPVCIESPEGPEASWAVPLVTPSGRVFVFYVFNGDDIRSLPADNPPYFDGTTDRMDSHGEYVFRWSDDHGRSWSTQRCTVPVREFAIDRANSTEGRVRLFWNVGRPLIIAGSVILTLHKVEGFGNGWFRRSEGAFVRSEDLLEQSEPGAARWITLPDGDEGLRTPPGGGPIAEEQSLLELSDGSLMAIYRSIDGHPVSSYSRDGGHTWQVPAYLQYANGGLVKHPRAACFAWRLAEGNYVLWFHNHGGAMLGMHPNAASLAYDGRNPAWMCRGREVLTPQGREIRWETPEVLLYEDDPDIRMSYPDLIETGETLFVTETQKAVARVHRIGPALVQAFLQGEDGFDALSIRKEAALDWNRTGGPMSIPALPPFFCRALESPYQSSDQRAGFTIEFDLDCSRLGGESLLLNAWQDGLGGIRLKWLKQRTLRVELSDGKSEFAWDSDNLPPTPGDSHHVIICVDGGPKIISFLVDGRFHDGGGTRPQGWGRFTPWFRGLPPGLPIVAGDSGSLVTLRIYPRALLFAESRALFLGEGPGASPGLW